jgi:uncharacterized membrane protein
MPEESQFNRDEVRRELEARSDRDLMLTTAVEIRALKFSLDQLREHGCDRFAAINREVGENNKQIKALQNGAANRVTTGLMILSIFIAGAAVVVAILVAVYK